jgi:hypothetical protein
MDDETRIGALALLLGLFIGLKIGGVIDWSWWWVFSPLWMPIVIVLFFFISLCIKLRKQKMRSNSDHRE